MRFNYYDERRTENSATLTLGLWLGFTWKLCMFSPRVSHLADSLHCWCLCSLRWTAQAWSCPWHRGCGGWCWALWWRTTRCSTYLRSQRKMYTCKRYNIMFMMAEVTQVPQIKEEKDPERKGVMWSFRYTPHTQFRKEMKDCLLCGAHRSTGRHSRCSRSSVWQRPPSCDRSSGLHRADGNSTGTVCHTQQHA